MNITKWLFRMARLSADFKAVSSGSRKKVQRRAKNKVAGRLIGKAGIWRKLWR